MYITQAHGGVAHKMVCAFGDIDQWVRIGIGPVCPHEVHCDVFVGTLDDSLFYYLVACHL